MFPREFNNLTVQQVLDLLPKIDLVIVNVRLYPDSNVNFKVTKKQLQEYMLYRNPDDMTEVFYMQLQNEHALVI